MSTMTETLRRAGDDNDATADLREFLDAVEALGLDSARQQSPEGRAFLEETAPLLANARVSLGRYIEECSRFARAGNEWSGDEWFSLCKRRSKIEFVRELYRDVAVDLGESFMDSEDLDITVRAAGDDEGGLDPSRIPPGMPRSHWWWWFPERT